ncbi:nicotinamide riboside transporter PnuC [Periweissella fabalis]|uniref:Nicotinamide mononucleotide transporter n=1 Tax=Periweissella fabalis TaxID=1070421 RepID=A0A7X6N491_9LACO|nr:nicotinamide riboside transporter PnuC [Periweissella fabalis]MCM0598393.1 nicotinamide mononucleotide transporter [Periweissella fabalis]NKZ24997.1 hypothetical protein [Periweissella fabalis]
MENVSGVSQNTPTTDVLYGEKFEGNYLQWIKSQLTGVEPFAWALYAFGMGMQFWGLITTPANFMSVGAFVTALIAFVSIGFGFLCTVMMAAAGWVKFRDVDGKIKERKMIGRSINGVLGAVSVIGYIFINWQAGHWWSILDQLVFFFAIDLQLMLNWRTWGHGETQDVKKLDVKGWIISIIALLAGWAILTPIGAYLNDSQPIIDALTLALGATASVLYVKRYTLNYKVWMFNSVIQIVMWFLALKGGFSPVALPMIVMTLLYMTSSIYGQYNFRLSNNNKVRDLQ